MQENGAHRLIGWDLGLAGLCVALGYAVLYSGPVFRAATATDLGWPLALVTGAFAAGHLASLPVPMVAGYAADRWGARRVILAGTALTALALLAGAASTAAWQWYLLVGVGLGVGVGTVWAGAAVLAAAAERRGASLGLVLGSAGVGLTLGPPVMQLLVDHAGWRWALAAFGLAALALTGVLRRAVRRRPAAADAGPWPARIAGAAGEPTRGDPQALPVAVLLVGFFAGNVLIAVYDEVVYQFLYAYGTALGLPGGQAAGAMSAVSLAYIAGMVGGGSLSDVLGRRAILILAAVGATVALVGIASAPAGALWSWGALYGLYLGGSISVRSAAWGDAFAGPRLGRSMGIVASGYPVGAALTTYAGAVWIDAGGSFPALFMAGAAAALGWAALGGALARPQAWEYAARAARADEGGLAGAAAAAAVTPSGPPCA